ncbi:phage tail sheath family protein [Halotia branconii]|uniref:Phage tail sheath subtilisin-like domain-containing protein n=1 Tax=Halotia branconii CENA392 TaxID=1539056 RepID=A0AAJ6NWE9_9CYAN|nr:phage tail sheath subtilisin-like domain-containing protein [Halotia branconii]WGV27994.1 phage tail sheath subtilisin-like domain-containing protein [Halotia branconii CENA392]
MYKTPGVYKNYIISESQVKKIRTGVPAFLGLCQKTEIAVNQPQPLKLWSQFEQLFGEPLLDSYLAYAVRGFFLNGGSLCYVVRLRDANLKAFSEGLAALAELDTIDLVCAPDIMRSPPEKTDPEQVQLMQSAVLNHCSLLGDRFAILDSLPRANLEQVQAQRQRLTQSYGALYYPWIRIVEGPQQSSYFVPPCGHIAGVYARSDRRIGVHKAPANEILQGVVDLEVNLTNAQQDQLNPQSINCLRSFPGRGIRVWGARTLSLEQDQDWLYINVRRLFLTVKRWIELNMTNMVFEPNSNRLWAIIERELTIFFNDLFQQGALNGRLPTEAFYVKCDEENNPPEVRNIGQVAIDIGLAPTVPGEFIVVRIVQDAEGIISTSPN